MGVALGSWLVAPLAKGIPMSEQRSRYSRKPKSPAKQVRECSKSPLSMGESALLGATAGAALALAAFVLTFAYLVLR